MHVSLAANANSSRRYFVARCLGACVDGGQAALNLQMQQGPLISDSGRVLVRPLAVRIGSELAALVEQIMTNLLRSQTISLLIQVDLGHFKGSVLLLACAEPSTEARRHHTLEVTRSSHTLDGLQLLQIVTRVHKGSLN